MIDVSKESDFADFFVVCSANSDRGVKSIAENVEKILKAEKIKISGLEGMTEGKWILIDTFDVVTHIFYEPMREFYDLEGLWVDSPRLSLEFSETIKEKV